MKLPEQQARINLQLAEDVADIKTQQLFAGQAVGALVRVTEGLIERLVNQRLLSAKDPLVREFREAVARVKKAGLRMAPPEDPDAPALQVTCPECKAVIRMQAGKKIDRCDWCGHVF